MTIITSRERIQRRRVWYAALLEECRQRHFDPDPTWQERLDELDTCLSLMDALEKVPCSKPNSPLPGELCDGCGATGWDCTNALAAWKRSVEQHG